jgi:hypothetical protein
VPLERRPARFATPKPRTGGDEEGFPGFDGVDEEKMGGIVESMMSELQDSGESEDPRKLAALFRRFGKEAGMEAGPQMEEMLSRMEAGEDMEQMENDMDAAFDEEGSMDELFRFKKKIREAHQRRPNVDEELYFL